MKLVMIEHLLSRLLPALARRSVITTWQAMITHHDHIRIELELGTSAGHEGARRRCTTRITARSGPQGSVINSTGRPFDE